LFLVDKELLLLDQLFLLLEVKSFASQTEDQLDLDLPTQLAYKLEVLFLALAQEFVQHYHKLELKCAVQTEDQLDLDLPTLLDYKLEVLLLFLALLVDKELLLPDQLFLYAQPFHKLETEECAILTEDLLDLDLAMPLAYNNEVLLLFLALLVVVPFRTLAPPSRALMPQPPLPTQ